MSEIPRDLLYTKEHVWVRRDGDRVRLGITDHAQDQLGDVLYVDLFVVDDTADQGEVVGEVESGKSVSEIHAPFSGRVEEKNEALDNEPSLVNSDPYGEGWLLVMTPVDPGDMESLLTADDYRAWVE